MQSMFMMMAMMSMMKGNQPAPKKQVDDDAKI
jgi:hypothetical protein